MTKFLKDYQLYIYGGVLALGVMFSRLTYGSIDSLEAKVTQNSNSISVCKVERTKVMKDVEHIRETVQDLKSNIETIDEKLDILLINEHRNKTRKE